MHGQGISVSAQKALESLVINSEDLLKTYDFYLAGGTALALQLFHRESVDLDFFTPKKFSSEKLVIDLMNNQLKLKDVEKSFGTVQFILEGCNVSFFSYPYEEIGRRIDYEVKSGCNIKLASLIDIALMKVTAIADRGSRKDFVDLYFLIKELGSLQVILEKFSVKYVTDNFYHYLKALLFFEIADNEPELRQYTNVDWKDVKVFIEKEVKSLKYLEYIDN